LQSRSRGTPPAPTACKESDLPKPTYSAIAERARVGTATVERVLNGRGGVRPETVEKVVVAARALDWPGRLPEKHRGIVRIEVILVRPESSFFRRLANAFRRLARSLDPAIRLHVNFVGEDDPAAIAARIESPATPRSGLVIASPGHPRVREALRKAQRAGLPIVQVVSRTLPEADFVGIDNAAAGRMAGRMLTQLNPAGGTIVALCHSPLYEVHRARIGGFSDYIAGHPPEGKRFACVLFGRDDRDTAEARVREALATWPDLAGLYNAGGANQGVFRALGKAGRKVFFVGHELNDPTAGALRSGLADVILDQIPDAQARRATDLLLWRIGLVSEPVENPPIRFTTVTAENV